MTSFVKLKRSSARYVRPFSAAILFAALVAVLARGAPAGAASPAEQGQAIFEQKCKACHSIGGGRLVGPDLRGVTAKRDSAWLISIIATPDKLISSGDPIAKQLVQQYGIPMPNVGVTEDDAKAIIAYLEAQSGPGPVPAPTPIPPVTAHPAANATSPSAQDASAPSPSITVASTAITVSGNAGNGRGLFMGNRALRNGGPACLSCHNVAAAGVLGGGTVGKDLTASYSTLGEAGLTSILTTAPFPMMQQIYTAKPLTADEVSDLLAFLQTASSPSGGTPQNPWLFPVIGAVAGVVIIGLFQLLWRGRLSGVRRRLVKGGSR